MKSQKELVEAHFNSGIIARKQTLDTQIDSILKVAEILVQAFYSGNKVLLCGNGGSAADCQHMATEFVSGLTPDAGYLPAIALTTDTSLITAQANDFGYDYIFERQIKTHGQNGDVLICISTGGNSRNVVRAVEAAEQIGMSIIVLTGNNKRSLLSEFVDSLSRNRSVDCLAIRVPCNNTQLIQEVHLAIEHVIVELVERELSEP